MRELQEEQIREKNKLDQSSPWLLLYEVWLDDDGSERLCHLFHDEAVTWDGRLYRPYPIRRGRVASGTDSETPSVAIAVSTLDPVIQPLLNTHHGFVRKRVRVITIHKDFLDDPAGVVAIDQGFIVQAMQDDSDGVVRFTVGQLLLAEEKIAWRTFGGRCDFRYRDPRTCAYEGALPSCDHGLTTPNGCEAHGVDSSIHPRRFGGQPSIPRGS
jgi:phage-related protein